MERAREWDATHGKDVGSTLRAKLAGHALTTVDSKVLEFVANTENQSGGACPGQAAGMSTDAVNRQAAAFVESLKARSCRPRGRLRTRCPMFRLRTPSRTLG